MSRASYFVRISLQKLDIFTLPALVVFGIPVGSAETKKQETPRNEKTNGERNLKPSSRPLDEKGGGGNIS